MSTQVSKSKSGLSGQCECRVEDSSSISVGEDKLSLTEGETLKILSWWKALSDLPDIRRQLRGIADPNDLLQVPMVDSLREQLPRWLNPPIGIAMLSGLLSQVEEYDPSMRFICRLGRCTEGAGPALSEIHFLRLSTAVSSEDFFRRIKRAVIVLGRAVDIPSLADCVLNWSSTRGDEGRAAEQLSLREKWHSEYRLFQGSRSS